MTQWFRMKPGVVEARRIPEEVGAELNSLCHWAQACLETKGMANPRVHVRTVGRHLRGYENPTGLPGDWVIRSDDGSLFICPGGLFEAMYEPIEKA